MESPKKGSSGMEAPKKMGSGSGMEAPKKGTSSGMEAPKKSSSGMEAPKKMGSGSGMEAPKKGTSSGMRPPSMDKPLEEKTEKKRKCATMEVHRRLLAESPAYAQARARLENITLEFKMQNRVAPRFGVVRIPTVVHVVWNSGVQNISDAQINSQMDVLNRDFRRLNIDVSQVPTVWQGLVGDMQLEFFLANTDPLGNPTTGITRTQTSITSFLDDDKVKSNATGGVDAWPTDRYLNIWVCQLGGSLLGYAQFPGGPPATDGVVITHDAFGTTGTASPPFELGRTATHEIGHWINLNHIWGDDGTGCTGTDNVDDTPNQGGFNVGCPPFPHISCGNGPNGDMFMNYMDYVNDGCMVMFTQGQVNRAQICMLEVRSTFLAGGLAGRLEVFARGMDSALWHIWQTAPSNGWSDWGSMGGWISDPVVARNADGRLEVFVIGTDHALWHIWQTAPNNGWSDWGSMGGVIDQIAVGQNADGRLEVFARGMDHALWHIWQTAPNNGWSDWGSMGGWISDPVVARNADGRLEVFVIGTDHALWHIWQTAPNNGWSDWGSMGGVIDQIAVGQNADGRLEVFARGMDSALWHIWQTAPNNGWSDWGSMGGVIDQIAVGQNADGRLEVFVIGTDHALWHIWQTAPSNGWSDWGSMGGWISDPVVARNADGRLEVFARGMDSALWHIWQTAPNNGWSDWGSMGGVIDQIAVGQNTG